MINLNKVIKKAGVCDAKQCSLVGSFIFKRMRFGGDASVSNCWGRGPEPEGGDNEIIYNSRSLPE